MSESDVTLIGLGQMGASLATMLLKHGHSVSLWNRRADRATELVEIGGQFIPNAADAVAASPVTIVCISNHRATKDLLSISGVTPAFSERTLIQLSTMTSPEAEELSTWAKQTGCDLLCGQILSFVDEVTSGRGSIVCSGKKVVFERHAALLNDAAGAGYYVGDWIGAAAAFDKAHLSFFLGVYMSFMQGAAMAFRAGADLRSWCDFNLRHVGDGPLGSELSVLADQICSRSYESGLDSSLHTWRDAVAKTIEECNALGLEMAHLQPLEKLFAGAIDSGFGDRELGVLYERMVG